MIRGLFGLLVLANLGLWMWGSWYKDADEPIQMQPLPPVNTEKMKLIHEPGVKLIPRKRDTTMKTLHIVKRVCQEAGPFPTTRAAMRDGRSVKKIGLAYSLRTQEITERNYQIYVPSLPTRKQAQAVQKKLNRLGFRDNSLITAEKNMKNAVSVGIFTVRANAKQRMRALKRKKIPVKLRTQSRVKNRYWLDIPADPLRLKALKRLSWHTPGVGMTATTCAH